MTEIDLRERIAARLCDLMLGEGRRAGLSPGSWKGYLRLADEAIALCLEPGPVAEQEAFRAVEGPWNIIPDRQALLAAGAFFRTELGRLRVALVKAQTPNYPRGKLNQLDEGELQMAVGVKDGAVVLAFPKRVTWIGLDRDTAKELGTLILLRAMELPDAPTEPAR